MSASNVADAIQLLSQGFLLSISIIIVPGPLNFFLLRQGLRRQHLFATAVICTLADMMLIAVGVGGASVIGAPESALVIGGTSCGACFLVWCGWRSLRSAWRTRTIVSNSTVPGGPIGLLATVAAALSFSLLNPASYLDTLLIIGSRSVLVPIEHRLLFGLGTLLASAFWFFSLTFGASRLSPLFRHPAAGRTLDGVSGCIMIGIAGNMVAMHML